MIVERTLEPQTEATVTILIVSSDAEDHVTLCEMFGQTTRRARTCQEALASFVENNGEMPGVVICERDLPDGNWKTFYKRSNASPVLLV